MNYDYYNPENKERFLAQIDLNAYPPTYWERLFRSLAPFEEEKSKDIFDFNKVEILDTYTVMNYTVYETLMVANINLGNYTKWAISEGMVADGINHFIDLEPNDLIQCVNLKQLHQSIISRSEVLDSIRTVINQRDRFILLGLFEGIRGKNFDDLLLVKFSDVKGNQIHLPSGKILTISQDLVRIIENTYTETLYEATDGRKHELFGDRIVRPLNRNAQLEDHITKENLYRVFHRLTHGKDSKGVPQLNWSDQVSLNSIFVSGLIDMIKTIMKQESKTAEEVLFDSELFKEITYRYELNKQVRRRFLLKYGELLA